MSQASKHPEHERDRLADDAERDRVPTAPKIEGSLKHLPPAVRP